MILDKKQKLLSALIIILFIIPLVIGWMLVSTSKLIPALDIMFGLTLFIQTKNDIGFQRWLHQSNEKYRQQDAL